MSGKRPPPNRPDLLIAWLDARLHILETRNQAQAAGIITPGVTDHGALTGLGDDDHTQYTTNTEAISLADTEIATHAALPNAHHNRDHSIIGTTHTSFPGGTTDFLRADGVFATPPAGSSGASVADHYIVGMGGESDTDLTNKVVIPGLSASPDIRVAGTNDWEFDSSSLTGWSTFAGGGAVSINDADTTIKSHLYVKIASNGAVDKFSGLIHAAPSVPYTVTGKLAARIIGGGWPCLFVSDSSTAAGAGVFVGAWDGNATKPASLRGGTLTNMQTFAGFVDSGSVDGVTIPLYCRIVVTAANNVTIQVSYDGLIWYNLHSGYSLLASAGYFGVCNDGFSFTTEMAWDWIRFT